MSATPAGYEAFHSKRRKGVTLLCFLLASMMAMGITVYIDSYSVHEWDRNLDVGPVAAVASGLGIHNYVDQIRAVDGVTKAVALQSSYGNIEFTVNTTEGTYIQSEWGQFFAPTQEFLDTFPDYISIEEGSLPTTNSSQIAIIELVAMRRNLGIGDVLNFSEEGTYPPPKLVEVIGIYTLDLGESDTGYYESIAIVSQNTLQNSDYRIFIDIDRSRLSAFSASGSLAYVNGIDQEIIKFDPQYDPVYTYRGTFWVQNYIESGIYTYSFWVQNLRISQLFRSTGIILLILMVTILAIRHNVNERKYEEGMLYSRGASQGDLDKIVNREVVVLSIFSCVLGILLGIGMSRIALGSTGFFKFDFTRMLSEPFLITLESLTIAVVVGIMIPLVSLGSYRIIYSTKRTVDEERGRLSRIVKGLNFIKWDVIVVVLSALLWMALMSGGLQNQGGGGVVPGTEILALMVPIVPLPLFLGVASLSIKALRSGARRISRVMSFAVGQIPAAVGIRRIGKGASSGGAAAMVLVLAICLSWNSAIVDASLPVTKTYQAQLSVGADITFALDNDIIPLWDNFTQNVTSSESVTAATYVSEYTMSLSSGYGGYCTFVAVSPQEYGAIGYDYRGKRLNDSEVENMLESLESVVDGAIISEDIAQAYDFEVGDIISAAEITEEPVVYTFRVIGIVKSLPEMPGEQTYYYGYGIPTVPGFFSYGFGLVGQGRIIINREYLQSLLGSLNQTSNYLCVSTSRDANGTAIGQSVLEAGGYEVLYNNIWDSVSSQRDEYLKDASYHIDRSVDTMMTVLTVGTIMGAFAIYAVEGVRARKREIALLRASGANNGLIVKAQGAEMLVLMIFSFVVLAGYSPLFLTTSIASAGSSFASYYEIYPIALFPVIPWLTIFTVLAFFVVSVVVFIGLVAILGSHINLAETLNASWAEAAPYGDDV